ncbi:MAG: bifunctional DNA primase/polymerase [Cryomorphaceae bacterium]|nr:bifunctional DNA primase/polymerase [Cryomorphaceae bacterium]
MTTPVSLAALGWFLCPMESGSKNPGSILGTNWPAKCSNDPDVISAWPQGCNFGVLLGSKSGLIDLEFDSETGEQLIESWLEDCGNPPTPSYRSAKSVHRLFKWEEKFSFEKKAFGRLGVEFRFGNDAAQSVIPPSIHESGAVYEWLEGLSPDDVEVAPLPDLIYKQYLTLRASEEKQTAKASPVDPRYTSGDSLLTKARNHVEETHSWESILALEGWKFARNRGEAQDWWRPGKTRGSISGTVNFGGSKTLRVFTSSTSLKAESSYDKFAYLCLTQHNDDPVKAAFALCPESVLGRQQISAVDLSAFYGEEAETPNAHEFLEAMLPQDGLIRWVAEYYRTVSQFPSPVMAMATAISFCQTIFGRRLKSQTNLRLNDYNVVMAPTGAGKEACETTIIGLFEATGYDLMHPPDVQSGNGFLSMVAEKPCGIWVCDEFGKMLESLLEKRANPHLRQIGTHLLKIYGKSRSIYGGAAHAAGSKHRISQPHLCLLGLTTPKVFSTITADQVDDGLFGRLAFFVCQDRPKMQICIPEDPPDYLVNQIKKWIEWAPMAAGNLANNPDPQTLAMDAGSFERWTEHGKEIRDKMDSEGEMRAGVWCRTAARTMLLALTHRAARMRDDPGTIDWQFIRVEQDDIEWAILMSNFLTRTSCNLLLDDVVDEQQSAAQRKILAALGSLGEISHRKICRRHEKITSAQFSAAAIALQSSGVIEIETVIPARGGRGTVVYRKPKTEPAN